MAAQAAKAQTCTGSAQGRKDTLPTTSVDWAPVMLRFVLRRCALVVPSLLGLLVVTFLLIHAVPSDPAVAMAGDAATPEQIARVGDLLRLVASEAPVGAR